jgi:hypothetical protein
MTRRRQRRERNAPAPAALTTEEAEQKKKDDPLGATKGGRALRRLLVGVAVVVSLGVAGIGGWRSFSAVSGYFHSWTVPAIADGVIVAASALRLAALTYRWRMPGSMLVTVVGLGGTVYLNVHASPGNGPDQFSHALAPVAYLVLLEMLGYFLKLRLKLEVQEEARLTLLVWLVSPVVTTRAWLLMVRTGQKNPALARAAIQRSIRARSQMQIICPAPWYAPLGAARSARSAALQTVRDGLLTAAQVVELLPEGQERMGAVELLVAVNRAALAIDTTAPAAAEPGVDEGQADEVVPDVVESEPDVDDIPELAARMERALAAREKRPPFHEMCIELGCTPEAFWQAERLMGGWEATWERLHPPKQEQQDEEQDSGRGRRRGVDGNEGDKKGRFLAAVAADLRAGDRRVVDPDSKVRNARARDLAKEIDLHDATAARYLRENLDETQNLASQLDGATLPIQRTHAEYNDADAALETTAHSA